MPNFIAGRLRTPVGRSAFLALAECNLVYVLLSVPLTLVAALGVAKLLETGGRGMGVFRLVFYLPSLLGASVAIAVVRRQIFAGNGVLNQLLSLVGIRGAPWISDPEYSLGVLVLLAVCSSERLW